MLSLTLFCLTPAILLAANGKELYKTKLCVNCHGQGGQSLSPQFPYLAGQNKTYLSNQFTSIVKGKRSVGSAAMMGKHPVLKDFTKQQIDAISSYLSKLPRPVQDLSADPKAVAKGRGIYKNIGCKKCHGEDGKGMGKGSAKKYNAYPKLNGQHSIYVYNQLKNILAGKRNNDNAKIMKKQLSKAKLNDHDLRALATYISQIH